MNPSLRHRTSLIWFGMLAVFIVVSTLVIATVGVQGDWVSDFDLSSGASAGIRYGWSEHWSMKINTGYNYNIPTFGQLYQPSHGSIDQARGNPDLDKEGVRSNDLAVEYRMNTRHLFQLALFRTDTDDAILNQRGSDRVFSPVNGGHSWRQGIEATWKYIFDFGLAVDTDVIVQDSRIEETDNELIYTPHLKARLALM